MTKNRDRNQEEKDLNEMTSVNNTNQTIKIKDDINKIITHEIKIVAKNESQKKLIQSIKNNQITICSGRAGCGKTFLAVAYALSLLRKKENNFKKIYLIKSVTPLKGNDIGFLPGNLDEKLNPFMFSYFVNMEKVISELSLKLLIEKGIIKVFPVAFARGVTFSDSIVILDECVAGENKIIINYEGLKDNIFIRMDKLPFYFKKFENLKVLSHNDKINIDEFKKINSIKITKNKETIKIKLKENGHELIVTKNHPFGIIKNGNIKYVKASELKINDRLLKRKNAAGNHSILNENNYDILLGFMLGDGCLSKNKQWDEFIFRLRIQHSLKQKEYNEFCANLFNTTCNENAKSGFTGEKLCVFTTKSFYANEDFIFSIFNNRKKRVTYDIKKYFTIRTLALWYMDDGSIDKYSENGAIIRLNTQGFNKSENEILVRILEEKFKIKAEIKDDRPGDFNYYYYLSLNNENSQKFQELIKELIFPLMDYKLNVKYRNQFKIENYLKYKNYYELTTSLITNISNGNNVTVYNMEVQDNNNYYINNILTHNCQNITIENSMTLLTRIGDNCKYIVLGDTDQIDISEKENSSLKIILEMFKNVDDISIIEMDDNDINVRNPIIDIIDKKYKEYFNSKKKIKINKKELLQE